MAELKFDWSACIVSGGAELINRVEAARAEYSSVCSEYFDYLVSKAGKTGVHGDRFEESACGKGSPVAMSAHCVSPKPLPSSVAHAISRISVLGSVA